MDEHGPFMDQALRVNGTRGEILVFRGCCIRFYDGHVHSGGWFDPNPDGSPAGPKIHANSAHIAVGVTAVSVQDDGDLQINTDGMTPVVTCSIDGDESISAEGIFGGASIGSVSVVRFFDAKTYKRQLKLNVQTDWDRLAGSLNNLWCSWWSLEQRGTDS